MALLDRNNVRVARTGGLWEADLGTALPTSNTAPVPSTFRGWGYLGTDGLGRAISETSEPVVAWQDNAEVATVTTESSATYTVPALETRKHIIETIYGTTVNEVDGSYVIRPGAPKPRRLFLFEEIDTEKMTKSRQWFEGQVIELGDINYVGTEAQILTPTIKVFGDIHVIDDKLKVDGSVAPEPTDPGNGTTDPGNGGTNPGFEPAYPGATMNADDLWSLYPVFPSQANMVFNPADKEHWNYIQDNDPTDPASLAYDPNWVWETDPRFLYLQYNGWV